MGKIRVKDDELRQAIRDGKPADNTVLSSVVAELSNAIGVKLRCHRIDEPFVHHGETRYNRFYCLAVAVPGQSDFLFPRTKNPNEIKRTVATIVDLINMGFLKIERDPDAEE